MSPALRKLALTVHLTTSLGWVGAVISYLGLGIAAVESSDTETIRAAWTAMEVTGWWVIVYWTVISLALTALCTLVLVLHMPAVTATARVARTVEGGERMLGGDLFHPGAGLLLLLVVTMLNVYKPEGLTPYGWHKQRDERRALRTSAAEPVASRVSGGFEQARTVPTPLPVSQLTTRAGYFVFHVAEMWFAMLVGMAAFMAVRITTSAQGTSAFADPGSIEFQVGMGAFMVTPMVAWMRLRGCGWRECGAMSAAMLLSTAAVLVSSALELHDVQLWLASNQHVLMLVGMLAFMVYRREHYTSGYSLGWRTASHHRARSSA